jgi:dihydroorotase
MPNLVPPITTKDALLSYKQRIKEACKDDDFEPYVTLFFQNNYSYEFLEDIKDEIIAIKLYPAGITTNSETGVASMDVEVLRPTLESMSKLGIPLCIHGETNGFVMDREKEFMPIYESIASNFPNLKIIMEHITTKDAIELLDKYDNLYATVTLHHLLITLDDVAGGMLQPHLFCKPIAKRPEDRSALLNAALKAHPKLMFGSDSAPHPKHKKECCGCAAGVFTAPIALQVLTQLFNDNNCLENLNKFVSLNAQKIYGIKPPKKDIKLIKKDFIVPSSYEYKNEQVVPMYAGETLTWRIEE